jgi:hypothetical protein
VGHEADRLAPVQRKGLEPLGPERLAEQGVVPDQRMGVERQVVGGQGDSARTPGSQKSP